MRSRDEQELRAQVEKVRARLRELNVDLRAVDDEVEGLASQRTQHELLDQACGSLERLGALGAGALFWGEKVDPARVAEQLRGARGRLGAFQTRIGELDGRRQEVLAKIGREEENLAILGEDLYDFKEAEERSKSEWIVEREISPVPFRVQLMAWARGGEDDRRFRRTLGSSLLASLVLGAALPMIDLPPPARFVPDDMPERLVQFIRQEQARPVPPPIVAKAQEQTKAEQETPKPPEEPNPSRREERNTAENRSDAVTDANPPGSPDLAPGTPGSAGAESRARVGKAGILAFRDTFASLTEDKVAPRLGSDARYNDAADAPRGSSRSMLTTSGPGSSRGINISSLSRRVGGGGGGGGAGALHGGGGGGGGGGIDGVQIGRATSSIASIGGGDRPLAHGVGPSRTDEEIQIVFDRYKAAFYRLYNRELRKDPTLRGQMVLRLTIEPDGSVSMCKVQSADIHAPDLADQVVKIVLTINFGAKEGVRTLTIVYPIDFLPAS